VLSKTEWTAILCGVDVGEPLCEYSSLIDGMSFDVPKIEFLSLDVPIIDGLNAFLM
jgi:hypothetical protein